MLSILVFYLLILCNFTPSRETETPTTSICIIGSGVGGSSVAHFLRKSSFTGEIRIFERHGLVGGRMATVSLAGHTFEAGASILHPKNYHAVNFAKSLNLTIKTSSSSSSSFSLGIWDGHKFIFKTLISNSKCAFYQKILSLINSFRMFCRYGFSLFRMTSFVETVVDSFLKYYESIESRPIFETVDDMLKWSSLYDLTRTTLQEELVDAGLSPLLIQELVTVITRINYGQSVSISGLAGAVSLAGSGGGLWSIEGGNWQMAAGLINSSHVLLHLHEKIKSVSFLGDYYELNSTEGNCYKCEVTVIATPLDEQNISFTPPISIPKRELQHTCATFVRGLLNPAYFGMNTVSAIPALVGTIESPDIPFSSISVLKQHSETDMSYKIFSREPLDDALLDDVFRVRRETIKINWAAYPRYKAPERFASFLLDGQHLYYVNAFENAASTIETMAVAAENVARLIISRLSGKLISSPSNLMSCSSYGKSNLHAEL